MTGLTFRAEVDVVDANVGVGHRHDRVHACVDGPSLLAEMDRHGVDAALVYPVQGEAISALDGNASLAAWVAAGRGRLWPQAVANAHPDVLAQLRQMHAEAALRSVRLHDTAAARTPLTRWIWGDLLEWLQRQGIPLWASLADNDAAALVDLLAGFPHLPSVLLGAHYTHAAMVRPLLAHLPAAHLELSRYEELGGVESLVRDVGAERLLYGSFHPRYAMGPVLFALHRCDLDAAQLAAICGGNARRLLGLRDGEVGP